MSVRGWYLGYRLISSAFVNNLAGRFRVIGGGWRGDVRPLPSSTRLRLATVTTCGSAGGRKANIPCTPRGARETAHPFDLCWWYRWLKCGRTANGSLKATTRTNARSKVHGERAGTGKIRKKVTGRAQTAILTKRTLRTCIKDVTPVKSGAAIAFFQRGSATTC